MKKVEYSQAARRKLKALKLRLTAELGPETAAKALKRITDSARGLADFEEKGVMLSSMFDIHCDYRYLYAGHNYLFYRIEKDRIIIVEIFDEREDFMYKLFGISSISMHGIKSHKGAPSGYTIMP